MYNYIVPTFELLMDFKYNLLVLDRHNEAYINKIWGSKESTLKFQDGKAVDLVYDDNIDLAGKMIFRLRRSADICFFWNALDPNNCVILLNSVGISSFALSLDFFVWLGNNHIMWNNGKLMKSTITTYFDADEKQQKDWIEEYRLSRSGE